MQVVHFHLSTLDAVFT